MLKSLARTDKPQGTLNELIATLTALDRSMRLCHAQDSDPRHGSQGIAEPPQVLTCVQVRAGNNGDEWETGVDRWKSEEESDEGIEGIMMRVAR
jgi:hypothetical protein